MSTSTAPQNGAEHTTAVDVDLTIDLTFTWSNSLSVFLAVLADGAPEGRRFARIELQRMAAAADIGADALKLLARLVETDVCATPEVLALLTRASEAATRCSSGSTAIKPAPTEEHAAAPAARIGHLAKTFCGKSLPVEILYSARGFYLGTSDENMPFSRESEEYWPKRELAERALANGSWTQRQQP
jgi:hypothetical protein